MIFPQNQTCCGQPAWNSGYRDEARAVASAQMACFRGTPNRGPLRLLCRMLRHHYPELFQRYPGIRLRWRFPIGFSADRVSHVQVLKISLSDVENR